MTGGRSFPPGSLIVGSLARAVRALDAAAIARLRLSAVHYAERAARYAAELVRVE